MQEHSVTIQTPILEKKASPQLPHHIGGRIANWFDNKVSESEDILTDYVQSQPNLGRVIVATTLQTAMNISKSFVDVLRIGEGVQSNTIKGYAQDTLRVITIVIPVAKGATTILRSRMPVAKNVTLNFIELSLEKIATKFPRKASGQKLDLPDHIRRFFLQDTMKYPKVQDSWAGKLLKMIPLPQKWRLEQGHIFIQQCWTRAGGPNQIFNNNPAANDALKRLGNAGWNLFPMPRSLNNELGKSRVYTVSFALAVYGTLAGETVVTVNKLIALYNSIMENQSR